MQEHENNNSKNNKILRTPEGDGRPVAKPRPKGQPGPAGGSGQGRRSDGQLKAGRQTPSAGQAKGGGQPRRPAPQSGEGHQSGQSRPSGSQNGQHGQSRPTGSQNGQQRPSGGQNGQRQNGQPRPTGSQNGQQRPSGSQNGQQRPSGGQNGQRQNGQPRPSGNQSGQASGQRQNGQQRPSGGQSSSHSNPKSSGQSRKQAQDGQRPDNRSQNPANGKAKKKPGQVPPQQAKKKKRRKILLFVVEIFLLLILLSALWVVNKTNQIQLVEIDPVRVHINKEIQNNIEQGTSTMQGYRNIALFGVDSRDKELNRNTRTDVIMIASINQDTKEVRLVSVYRDTWLNMTNDKYSKANAAYAKGGAEQAIGMLNMNLDLDITDFVTVGFDAVIDVVDAIGGVEIDVTQEEIAHLNSYQISMVGKVVGGDEYYAVPYVEYTPVEHPGLQTLNGLQATAYARIRYTSGGDGARTERQRRVLTQIAKKAMTMNPATLNKIVDDVFGEIATSLTMSEILELLSDIASYQIGETSGFPFSEHVKMNGFVGKASFVVPIDLTKNVSLLHEFLFDESDYVPTDTVNKCSQKIALDTGISYNGE